MTTGTHTMFTKTLLGTSFILATGIAACGDGDKDQELFTPGVADEDDVEPRACTPSCGSGQYCSGTRCMGLSNTNLINYGPLGNHSMAGDGFNNSVAELAVWDIPNFNYSIAYHRFSAAYCPDPFPEPLQEDPTLEDPVVSWWVAGNGELAFLTDESDGVDGTDVTGCRWVLEISEDSEFTAPVTGNLWIEAAEEYPENSTNNPSPGQIWRYKMSVPNDIKSENAPVANQCDEYYEDDCIAPTYYTCADDPLEGGSWMVLRPNLKGFAHWWTMMEQEDTVAFSCVNAAQGKANGLWGVPLSSNSDVEIANAELAAIGLRYQEESYTYPGTPIKLAINSWVYGVVPGYESANDENGETPIVYPPNVDMPLEGLVGLAFTYIYYWGYSHGDYVCRGPNNRLAETTVEDDWDSIENDLTDCATYASGPEHWVFATFANCSVDEMHELHCVE